MLGDADRVVSTVAEDTVTVGILLPATTQDEQDGDPTTSGHSSLLSPGKVNRPVMHGLVGVKNDAPSGWEGREYVLEINGFKGHLLWGQSYTLWVFPLWENLWAKALVCKAIAQMLRESRVVGPKA